MTNAALTVFCAAVFGSLSALLMARIGFAAAGIVRLWHRDARLLAAAGAVLGLLAAAVFDTEAERCAWLLLATALAALARIDCRTYRLPDRLTLPLAALGLLVEAWRDPGSFAAAAAACLAFVVGWRLLDLLSPSAGLPGGDFKLLAAAAAWTGPHGAAAALVLACAAARSVAAIGRRGRKRRIPFGAYLAPAIILVSLTLPVVTALFPTLGLRG